MRYISTWLRTVFITAVLFITSLFSPLIDLGFFLFLKITKRADEFTTRIVLNNYEEGETPVFYDYWTCAACQDPHYGMCYHCGKCGRIFKDGILTNEEEYPSNDEEEA